jgi:hypothetical protein
MQFRANLQCTYYSSWTACVHGESWHCTKVKGSCERNAGHVLGVALEGQMQVYAV